MSFTDKASRAVYNEGLRGEAGAVGAQERSRAEGEPEGLVGFRGALKGTEGSYGKVEDWRQGASGRRGHRAKVRRGSVLVSRAAVTKWGTLWGF